MRIGPDGRFARASAHHGYDYELGRGLAGLRVQPGAGGTWTVRRTPAAVNGWGPETGTVYISGGSHAGAAHVYRQVSRTTKDHRLELIPIETLAGRDAVSFAISPPWRKRVYLDPEYSGTD